MISTGMMSESPAMCIGPSWSPPSASATPSAVPRMITGNDHMMSSTARTTVSVGPRKYPETTPSRIDRNVVMTAATTPIMSELRPP